MAAGKAPPIWSHPADGGSTSARTAAETEDQGAEADSLNEGRARSGHCSGCDELVVYSRVKPVDSGEEDGMEQRGVGGTEGYPDD